MSDQNVEDIFGLTPMQHLMLTHTLTTSQSNTLTNQFRYMITGTLDESRLQNAWERLVQRHAALRTVFLWEDLKKPVQVVRSTASSNFNRVDLTNVSEPGQSDEVQDLLARDRVLEINIRRAPLSRITLIRLNDDRWMMIWTRHHLILDRWCVDLMFDELFAMYEEPDVMLDKPGLFRDYVRWIDRQNPELAREYWRHTFDDVETPTLLFAANKLQAGLQSNERPYCHKIIPANVLDALEKLARTRRTTLAIVLQAAVATLVSAIVDQTLVIFGLTVAGRPADLPDVENTMGSFINNVPVVFNVKPDATLVDWLDELHTQANARQSFEYLSLADVHIVSGLPFHLPLFDLLALFHSPATEKRIGPGFEVEQLEGPIDSNIPFVVSLAKSEGSVELHGAYDPVVTDACFAKTFVEALVEVLERFGSSPESTLDNLGPSTKALQNLASAKSSHDDAIDSMPPPPNVTLNDESETMLSIWREVLGYDSLGLDDDFFALGGTSVQAAMLFTEIEKRLGKALPMATLFSAGSVRELLALYEHPQPRTSLLVAIQPRGSRKPLIVVPGIGGNVIGLHELARACGSDQPFFGLQSKGLDGIQRPSNSIEQIAAEYIAALPERLSTTPFVLFGICWGATVVLEMARQLAENHKSPDALVLIDPIEHSAAVVDLVPPNQFTVRAGFVLNRLKLYLTEFRRLSKIERRAWLRGKWQTMSSALSSGEPFSGVSTTIANQWVTDSNLRAMRKYHPQKYNGPAHLLITGREVAGSDPRKAFLRLLAAETEVVSVSGKDTGDSVTGQNAQKLATVIRKWT
jgi:thioesterase domain-containing protein/acyl carrier protein